MPEFKYTAYFENEVLRKRPYIKRDWCIKVLENPIRVEVQGDTRVRFWGEVAEFGIAFSGLELWLIELQYIMRFLIAGSNYENKLLR